MSEEKKYELTWNIVVPRDSYQVWCPFEHSNERVVSDVIPTAAITPTFPLIGTDTFGAINWANQPARDGVAVYSTYILRQIIKEGPDFTRLAFVRPFTAAEIGEDRVPYFTETKNDDFEWDPVLKGVKFYIDHGNPIVTRAPGEWNDVTSTYDEPRDVFVNRYVAREFFTPEALHGTGFKTEYFLSDVPFEVGQYAAPIPRSVTYDYGNISGRFPRCLGPKLVFDELTMATVAYATGDTESSAAGSALPGQTFNATNFQDWASFVWRAIPSFKDGLHMLAITTVYPPAKPQLNIQ